MNGKMKVVRKYVKNRSQFAIALDEDLVKYGVISFNKKYDSDPYPN
jgi:hypothetical protein